MTNISERKKGARSRRVNASEQKGNREAFVLIPVTQGRFTKVDAADALELSKYRWYLARKKSKYREYAYAARNGISSAGKIFTIFMHREILGLIGNGVASDVDHRNGDGLDNTRANLRIATRSMNARNKKIQGNKKSSIYKGVYPAPGGRWRAQINNRSLGYFDYEADAAAAYNRAAHAVFGEFAHCNDTSNWTGIAPELPLKSTSAKGEYASGEKQKTNLI
jgi:hypothetical protein